ncbi:MAG: tRNA (N6-threonylcarbamoyladenosine(37)-N6)-methyltransferase TrmO [Anaerolineae bacterium]|jgi:tRNA-Thr(GGU) m(6)t(6)A37 methyltransferase TsaA|nr:tRNA (N6-threonylcarbamoyladenosine(37)-N6)-methyltransferase TrmO [Anaerolineae bacterium]MBT7191174.1 tRNA (N6-threonylcarbamoyladenosine(37)-N6)-methyltransferase TrmO [Anaerolineae bacterium]MBT7990759.1 tRNA (N6-threonylcarbamoyladenosine(37)-N6)-methyltransferase TrmO [Anaerolineae bacterium]
MCIRLTPIGFVENTREEIEDDNWGEVVSKILLTDEFGKESLAGIEEFSHAEIIFYFDRVKGEKVVTGARYPRGRQDRGKVGIFAQRGKNRPNRIGLTTVTIIRREGKILFVQGLDAINGTPVLDIKPVMEEFQPKEKLHQPKWATELMNNYWKK